VAAEEVVNEMADEVGAVVVEEEETFFLTAARVSLEEGRQEGRKDTWRK
jgi:hypothetical protein